MNVRTHYEILGVDEEASADEIKSAWRRLVFCSHPDKNPCDLDADVKFRRIDEAYRTLADPELRADYDRQLADWRRVCTALTRHLKPSSRNFPQGGEFSGHTTPEVTPPVTRAASGLPWGHIAMGFA
ncbi:MAG: J domain-containing protein, partial [Myxococcales bacterium]|nr:J domain-containing protein [Myxococcales bacterium]